jgi:hypothetical protein
MLLLLSLALSLFAHAGNGNVVGNGGNSVICMAPSGDSSVFVQRQSILDIAEGETYFQLHYKHLLSLRQLPLETGFARALALFLSHSDFERTQLALRMRNFKQEVTWAPMGLLPLFTFSRLQLHGCTVHQAAIQYGPAEASPSDPLQLSLSLPIWQSLTTDLRVALLFHEFLLKDRLLMQGACSVDQIRELVGFLLSDEALAASASDWNFELARSCHKDPGGRD